MATLIDEFIREMVSSNAEAARALRGEDRFGDELDLVSSAFEDMLTCFSAGGVLDEKSLCQKAYELLQALMPLDAFVVTAYGDGVLRLCTYILNVISNPFVKDRISDRIARVNLELNAVLGMIERGALGNILAIFSQILENSSGLTPKGEPVPTLASGLLDILNDFPETKGSEFARRLNEFVDVAMYATGGISNPWTRKVREQSEILGHSVASLVICEDNQTSLSRSKEILEQMMRNFRGGAPTDLTTLSALADELDALLVGDDEFRETYLGDAQFGISSYLLRNLEQKRMGAHVNS